MKHKKLLYPLGVIVLASCSIWQILQNREEEMGFPHEKHVVQEKMECVECHKTALSEDKPGMPTFAVCLDCHDMEDEKKSQAKSYPLLLKLQASKREEPWELFHLSDDIVFSHKKHVDSKLACNQCHKGIEEHRGLGPLTLPLTLPTMEGCVSCHEAYKTSTRCQDCHKEIRQDKPPLSHKKDWKYLHGDEVFLSDEVTKDRCTLCHGKDGCNQCHQAEKPKSHNQFWRRTGHGLSASADRSRCALCHKEDGCIRCHEETKPRSHTGSWGQSSNLHCLSCHEPASGLNCSVCHKDTAGHASFTPSMPNDTTHSTATDCRSCHGDLKHPDNGQDCRICHR